MKADVQGVGEFVLLDLEGYQFLMARDDARRLGSALLRVVASGGDVLDGLGGPCPEAEHQHSVRECMASAPSDEAQPADALVPQPSGRDVQRRETS